MGKLDDMMLFAEVVERGSFSAVAEGLDLSRSLISKRISALEKRLGVRLLNRTTRSLRLTESGEVYYRYCSEIRDSVGEAEQRVGELSGQPQGTLRVSVPVMFGEQYIAPLLGDFLARYPTLQVDLSVESRFVNLVEEGFDMALRIGQLDDSSMIARRLASTSVVVCASPDYLKQHGTPQHPNDLAEHNCLTYRHERLRSTEWQFGRGHARFSVRVSGNLRADNGLALRNAALSGLGVVIQPTFMCACDVAEGRLVEILRAYRTEDIGIYAVYPSARNVPAKLRLFVDYLVARFAEMPSWAAGV